MRSRGAFGLVEVLIAAVLLGALLVPLVGLSHQAVSRASEDRGRIVASMLAANAVARLAKREPDLDAIFPARDGNEWTSGDVLASRFASHIGADGLSSVIRGHGIQLRISLTKNVVPGADLLVCTAWYHTATVGVDDSVSLARLIVDDVPPAPPGGP